MFSKLFSKKQSPISEPTNKKGKPKIAPERIGDLGEYKINIQLDQLPKDCKPISDLMLPNAKSKSGYSQIDHIILSPYTIFVIETKNYAGTIYGDFKRAKWSVNGKFPMMNPFHQNYGHIKAIHNLIPQVDITQFVSMVSFTKRSTFKVNEELRKIQSNELIVYDTELSEFMARKINVLKLTMKTPAFTEEQINEMYTVLKTENILDPYLRANHVQNINSSVSLVEKELQKGSKAVCHTCGMEVSEKVSNFCSANKARFNGNIYCFEHQKDIL
ncbi:MAG: nuclease-related domain-containing protein [Paenisporosarcina sp.]